MVEMSQRQRVCSTIDLFVCWKLESLPQRYDTAKDVVEKVEMMITGLISICKIEGKAPVNEGVLYHQLHKTHRYSRRQGDTIGKRNARLLHRSHRTAFMPLTYIISNLYLRSEC